jgi:hypothetical protein
MMCDDDGEREDLHEWRKWSEGTLLWLSVEGGWMMSFIHSVSRSGSWQGRPVQASAGQTRPNQAKPGPHCADRMGSWSDDAVRQCNRATNKPVSPQPSCHSYYRILRTLAIKFISQVTLFPKRSELPSTKSLLAACLRVLTLDARRSSPPSLSTLHAIS